MRKVISILLLLSVVSGSFGFPVYKHTCHVFDRTEISILNTKPCCNPAEQSESTTVDWQCCTLQEFDTSLSFETLIEKPQSQDVFFMDAQALSVDVTAASVITSIQQVNRPPPLANRDIHTRYQVFLL